jgi:hypothetical protein
MRNINGDIIPRVTETPVLPVYVEDGRLPPGSPHGRQECDWQEIHRQRTLANGERHVHDKAVAHDHELARALRPLTTVPYWP